MYRHLQWLVLPGVFHRRDFPHVIEIEREFFVEVAGEDDDGVALYRIYYRPLSPVEPPRHAAAAAAGLG